jgi:hypothetical protein
MRGSAIKKMRKILLKKTPEFLLILRNEVGERSKDMGSRRVYQHAKKLYRSGKLNELKK